MLAEGKNPVLEALSAGKKIEKLLVLDKTKDPALRTIVAKARAGMVRVEFLQREALDRISKTKHHQGVIAYLADFEYANFDQCIAEEKPFLVFLDKITDPHNLGSIIRSAECAGVTAVVIPARGAATVNETVLRTSAGAASHVKICMVNNLNEAIKKAKEQNIFVYALDMDGECMYDVDLTGKLGLIVGSEGDGVSQLTRKLADKVVSIPMKGRINSLNASVSASIVMFEVVRQSR